MTGTLSLQQAIDNAGSAVDLIWRQGASPWTPPVVKPEYEGWAKEQSAWHDSVAFSDLSHHMGDLFITGPDALRFLSDFGVNDFSNFALGQAKQYVPVTPEGYLIADAILLRDGEEAFTLTGNPGSHNWLKYQASRGGYDIELTFDPDSGNRQGGDPVLFRYQIQGPNALALAEKMFGGPMPKVKFFHSAPVSLGGRSFRALRHGMAGQPGYEFIGDFRDGAYVRDALMKAGEEFGVVAVGGKAYSTNGIESGWLPGPIPGIYSAPELKTYREFLGAGSYEGRKPLYGSYFTRRIEDYYYSPYELGYGKVVAFNHDFLGREALEKGRDQVRRRKVTLELDEADARRLMGGDFFVDYGRYRIENGSKLVGLTSYTGRIAKAGKVLSLSLVEPEHAEPGTRVTFVWGNHPGGDTAPDAEPGFVRIGATVRPSPYDEYARTQYRRD
jgi:vanillate/3-O-methylgallate O-demethylase